MTPTDVPPQRVVADWQAWWQNNRNRRQIEWIRDGLVAYGVSVSLPPLDGDSEPLLEVLGSSDTNEYGRPSVPHAVWYNAFRWLRDSGFDPVEYAWEHPSLTTASVIRVGVNRYRQAEQRMPASHGIGILDFSNRVAQTSATQRPLLMDPEFINLLLLYILLPLFGGVLCLLIARRLIRTRPTLVVEPHPSGG
jgi:hypothetical protein